MQMRSSTTSIRFLFGLLTDIVNSIRWLTVHLRNEIVNNVLPYANALVPLFFSYNRLNSAAAGATCQLHAG